MGLSQFQNSKVIKSTIQISLLPLICPFHRSIRCISGTDCVNFHSRNGSILYTGLCTGIRRNGREGPESVCNALWRYLIYGWLVDTCFIKLKNKRQKSLTLNQLMQCPVMSLIVRCLFEEFLLKRRNDY